jgi:hypothetical protein
MRRLKRLFLVLPIVAVLVAALWVPATALAGGPVGRNGWELLGIGGSVTYIDEGVVVGAGQSGRWVVANRTVTGEFDSGAWEGLGYSLTYGSNVPIATQSGSIHGTLDVGEGTYIAKVRGKSSAAVIGLWLCPINAEFVWAPVLVLNVAGSWAFIDGTQGNGDFGATVYVALNPEGHIDHVLAESEPYFDFEGNLVPASKSTVEVSGKWKAPQ